MILGVVCDVFVEAIKSRFGFLMVAIGEPDPRNE